MTGGLSMSEVLEQVPVATPPGAAEPTAGKLLRQAREAAGLHIAALAVSLKVPVRKLEALEADRLDLLPDAVFVRALASSMCRALKVDPAPVLERLPQTVKPRLDHDASGINTPFRAPGDGPRPSVGDALSRPAVLAVLVLLLGALILVFLPSVRHDEVADRSAADATGMPAAVNADAITSAAVPQSTAVAAPVPAQPSVADAGAASGLSATLAVSVAPSTPTVASPTAVLTPAAAAATGVANAPPIAAAGPAPESAGIVVFRTQGESWVEVTDAKGVVTLRRTLAGGETVGASGVLPLSVVVGRADSTQVQVRGKPFELAPLARNNIARFEVK
jgi:cytoskeleton protein RodZ